MNKEITIANRLFELREELLGLASTATAHFFRLGEIMREIRDNELWCGQYESFGAFYSDPDLGYKKSSVYHAIKLVEMFPQWKEVADIPLGKLIMIAPHISETNREELVSEARALSGSDLHHQLILKNLATIDKKFASFPKVYPCAKCGKVAGITFRDLCHCGWPQDHLKKIENFIDNLNMGRSFQKPNDDSEITDEDN